MGTGKDEVTSPRYKGWSTWRWGKDRDTCHRKEQ